MTWLRGKRRRALAGAAGGLVAALTACAWWLSEGELVRTVYRDSGSLRLDAETVRVRKVLWAPPEDLAVAPGTSEPEPSGSAPARSAIPPSAQSTLVLSRPSGRGDPDLFFLARETRSWSAPRPAGKEVNSPADEVTPALASWDGELYLFFSSDRPGGLGGLDLWVSRRGPGEWEAPRNLGGSVNSPYDDWAPAPHPRERLLVFATNRPRGFLLAPPPEWNVVALEGRAAGDRNLAVAAGTERRGRLAWGRPAPVNGLHTRYNEEAPAFSPDGELLYFATDEPGGHGGLDLYRSRVIEPAPDRRGRGSPAESPDGHEPPDGREAASPLPPPRLLLGRPENLRSPVNTEGDETTPRALEHGFVLVFRRRPAEAEGYSVVESRSVEVEEELEVADLPLAALARNLGRVAGLALAGAALIALLVILFRMREAWTTSLLARSAVAAVLVHAVLLWGFYFWKVRQEILAQVKEEERELFVAPALAASISIEAARQELDVPEPPVREATAAPLAERRRASDPGEVKPYLETVAGSSTASPESARVEPVRPELRELASRLEPAPDRVRAPALERRHLPVALSEEPRPSEDLRPVESAEALVVTEEEMVRTTSAGSADVRTPSPSELPAESGVSALARTAVLAPDPSPILPAASETPAVVELEAALPVPAQAPRSETQEPSPRRSEPMEAAVASSVAASEPPRPVPATRIEQPLAHWESRPAGITPLLQPIDSLEALPESLLSPSSRPYPVASTRLELPEHVPLAERSSSAPSGKNPLRGPASAASRTLPSVDAPPAPVRSAVAAAAASPRSLAQDAAAVVESALARLEPRSAPGSLLIERPLEPPTASSGRPRLPEAPRELSSEVEAPPGAEGSRRPAGPLASLPDLSELLEAESPAAEEGPRREWKAPPAGTETEGLTAVASPESLRRDPLGRGAEEDPGAEAGEPPPAPPVALAELLASERSEESSRVRLEEVPPHEPFRADIRKLRAPENRARLVELMGGDEVSEEAVLRALDWLARHQSPDGRWDSDGFDRRCGRCTSLGYLPDIDSAVTAMAVLCYLGHNHTPGSDSPFAPNVALGLDWLVRQQDPATGSLAGADRRYTMYSHAIAALALSEAFLMSRDRRYLRPLRQATELILRAQNPSTGGWRYLPRPPLRGDTSITGWQVLALASVSSAGIEIPDSAFDRSRHWLDREAGGGEHGGVYSYQRPDDARPREAMTAEGMYARQLLGGRRGDPRIDEAARYLHRRTRDGTHLNNLYLLYYGTLALYQYQGWIWESWNDQVKSFLVSRQRRQGTLEGSWDPLDKYMETGGRVLATAFATLTLEVYYRYLPLYWDPGNR